MPKTNQHFDTGALCDEAHEQDHGLIVTTNNPGMFRRILYVHFRHNPEHKLIILADPESPSRLWLLKRSLDSYVPEATPKQSSPSPVPQPPPISSELAESINNLAADFSKDLSDE